MRNFKRNMLILVLSGTLNGCCEECYECVKCTSYDSNNEVVREVFNCDKNKSYLNGFVDGFKKKSAEQGYTVECKTTGVKCD